MIEIPVTAAVEGDADAAAIRRIGLAAGRAVEIVHGTGGKSQLDRRLDGFNNAARYAPWLVLRDLNGDADCAPALVTRLLPLPAQYMAFRVAVRAMEAWLLGDRENLPRFLGVRASALPDAPEDVPDPKSALIQLARVSRYGAVVADMVPRAGLSTRVGPGYTGRLIEFIDQHWDPIAAAGRCPSLARCLAAIQAI